MAKNALQRKAESFEGRFQGVILRAFRQGQRVVSAKRIQRALDDKNRYLVEQETAVGLRKVDEVLREALPALLLNVLAASANVVGTELPVPPAGEGPAVMRARPIQPAVRFDRTNPEAIKWAQDHASAMIRDITEASREAINDVIAKRLASGASTAQTSKVLQQSVGLNRVQAAAMQKLSEKLQTSPGKVVHAGALQFRVPSSGMSRQQMDAALNRYSDRLTKARAKMISRTATRESSTEGQNQMWRQARAKGLLTGTEKRMWIASANACPQCSALGGTTATLDGRFAGGIVAPPAHGNCTCTQALTYD